MVLKFNTSTACDKIQFNLTVINDNEIESFYKSDDFFEMQTKLINFFNNNIFQLYFEVIYPNTSSDNDEKIINLILSLENKNLLISFLLSFKRNFDTCHAFMARKPPSPNSFFEIRLASAGNVDSGKSTLLGVLTSDVLDDGRGLARSRMFRHPHELATGRTSSVGESLVCVDGGGKLRGGDHRGGEIRCGENRIGDSRLGQSCGINPPGGETRGGDMLRGEVRGGDCRGGDHLLGDHRGGGDHRCGENPRAEPHRGVDRQPHPREWDRVPANTFKIFNLFDLAGHEKYLRTTIYGLVGLRPDYIMLVIGSNMGLVGMAKEHLGLSLALEIPIFFIITKIDICPEDVRKNTIQKLVKIMKSLHPNKNHLVIKNDLDVLTAFSNLSSNQLYPIFQISCVTGQGLEFLRLFLSLLPPRHSYNDQADMLFSIEDTYNVPGIGCVVSGSLSRGILTKNDNILLGPFSDGSFMPLKIKSIHRKRTPVDIVLAGQSCSIALKKIKREDICKGMVLISSNSSPKSYWQFKAFVHILHHPTTICTNYQAYVHAGPVRQAAKIIAMDKEVLRTGDKAMITMKFLSHPEYLVEGVSVVFREGRTKAIGTIKELLDPAIGDSQSSKQKVQQNSSRRNHRRFNL